MIRCVHRVGGAGGSASIPAGPPSSEICTCFRKLLLLISSPSEAAKQIFFCKSYRNWNKLPKFLRIFFTYGTDGCWTWLKFLGNWRFWPCSSKAPVQDGQLVDCPVSGQGTPWTGCKGSVSRGPRFLPCILPAPGSRCTGTSWPRGCICVFVFNSSR